jgi:sarcosine oxidase
MPRSFDVIVIGLGGMGSAAAYHLAARGSRVLGLERFTPAHNQGSSHGESRIIRQAYFEDPAYVPLLLRAYDLWHQIERETDEEILTVTGGLMMGPAESRTVSGSLASAEQWGLAFEMMDASEISKRWPTFTPGSNVVALYEKEAGFVRPELSVASHLRQAEHFGAELHFQEPVSRWEADFVGGSVRVTSAKGRYEAGTVVVCPGAWAPELLASLGLPLTIERHVQYWFAPLGRADAFRVGRHPIYVWEAEDGVQLYGFPSYHPSAIGVKVAFFRMGTVCTPATIDKSVSVEEVDFMRSYLTNKIPTLAGNLVKATPCMYTTTPDEHFVITVHPHHPQVILAAGFSGHGFKFASVVGEILADLTINGETDHPIDLFNVQRFAK